MLYPLMTSLPKRGMMGKDRVRNLSFRAFVHDFLLGRIILCAIFVIVNPRTGLILNKESRLITLRLKRDVENYDLMRTKGMKPGGRVNIRSHIQEELNSDLGTQKNDPECPHQVPATLTKVGFQVDAL